MKSLSNSKFVQEEKLEEIQNIIEMKVTHRRNINKRRAKWGFESNSTIGMDLGAANVIAPDAEMEEGEEDIKANTNGNGTTAEHPNGADTTHHM